MCAKFCAVIALTARMVLMNFIFFLSGALLPQNSANANQCFRNKSYEPPNNMQHGFMTLFRCTSNYTRFRKLIGIFSAQLDRRHWSRPVTTGYWGSSPNILCPPNYFVSRKICFKHITKILPLLNASEGHHCSFSIFYLLWWIMRCWSHVVSWRRYISSEWPKEQLI